MLLRKIISAAALAITVTLLAPAAAVAAPDPSGAGRTTTAAPADVAGESPATTSGTGRPVIVVGGMSGFAFFYEPIAARLRAEGFRVFTYELPGLGFGDITASGRALAGYVERVRRETGSATVDLVGHSQGGLVARYYLKRLGGTDAVAHYVSLGAPEYGTYVANIVKFLALGSCAGVVPCEQMTVGSAFLADLNDGDDTPGAVRYTTVRTLQDELVRPVDNAALADGATNVLIQASCPLRIVGHIGLALDGTTYTIIRAALRDAPVRPNCFAL